MNPTSPRGVKAWREGPLRPKEKNHTHRDTLGQIPAAVFVDRPTQRASMAQGLFLGGTGRRAVAHMRPAFPKNTYGPVGIPLIRGASGAGR